MNRILVIRGGALGDFLVTLPVLRLLRGRWPEARIELLGRLDYAPLAVGRFYLDAARSSDTRELARFFIPDAELDPAWREYFASFDLIVSYLYDPDGLFKANLQRCTSAQIITGNPKITRGPAAAHLAESLVPLELRSTDWRSRIHLGLEDKAVITNFKFQISNYITLHPGSGSPAKNWPLSRWQALAAALDGPVVVTLGEAEGPEFAQGWSDNVRVLRGLGAVELAALLAESRIHLGGDTGVTHLAAAAGAPTVALFGPTDEKIWAPPGDHVRVIRGGDFMGDISVEMARNALLNPPPRAVD
jgi:heptosyltransferase-2